MQLNTMSLRSLRKNTYDIIHVHDLLLNGKHTSLWKRCTFCISSTIYKPSPSSLRTVLQIIKIPAHLFTTGLCLLIALPDPSWTIKFYLLIIWSWALQMPICFFWWLEYSINNSEAGVSLCIFSHLLGKAKKRVFREERMKHTYRWRKWGQKPCVPRRFWRPVSGSNPDFEVHLTPLFPFNNSVFIF